MAKGNQHLEGLEQTLQQWTDERYFTRDSLRDVYLYERYLVNLLDDRDIIYRGDSFRYSLPLSLLVVKVTIGDEPYVCFINGRLRETCYRIFLRRLQEDTVEWRVDQYG